MLRSIRYIRFVVQAAAVWIAFCHGAPAWAANCTGPAGVEMQILYNTTQHVLQYCNGTSWVAFGKQGSGSSSCTSPASAEGSIVYNSDYHTYQFCNGTTWAAFTSGPMTCANCNIMSSITPAGTTGAESPVTLGTVFFSEVAGRVTGVRFYKGSSSNNGTHKGDLWDMSGNKLAEVTFTGETSTGWQTMNFASPVSINANTYYIISYYCPNGYYSYTSNGFTGSEIVSGPLHAIADGAAGFTNGVYNYATNPSFPATSFNATNYFVDVVFSAP